jgi:hypothetical protein
VVIDLTDVSFIGVPGLRALLVARRTAAERRVRLTLRARSGPMTGLLGLVGVGDATEELGRPDPSASAGGTSPLPAAPDRSSAPELESALRALGWSATESDEDLSEALLSVAETAVAHIPGAEGAGVLLVHEGGALVSHAATDPVVQILDLVQQERRCGPAWQSVRTQEDVVVDDLVTDPRWPDVVAEVAGLGIRSLLCLHLQAAGTALGVLTVYSSTPGAFEGSVRRLGQTFATVASLAVLAGWFSSGRTGAAAAVDRQGLRDVRTRAGRQRAGTRSDDALTATGEP